MGHKQMVSDWSKKPIRGVQIRQVVSPTGTVYRLMEQDKLVGKGKQYSLWRQLPNRRWNYQGVQTLKQRMLDRINQLGA